MLSEDLFRFNCQRPASVDLAAIRATKKYAETKAFGAHTILDTPPSYYSSLTTKELIEKYL